MRELSDYAPIEQDGRRIIHLVLEKGSDLALCCKKTIYSPPEYRGPPPQATSSVACSACQVIAMCGPPVAEKK